MGKDKTNDALATVMQGLQETIKTMNQPRTVTLNRGPDGKAVSAISSV
jgi:hypothetical protein